MSSVTTVCIAEVRIFDAKSGTAAKFKNKITSNEQMLTDVRLPRTPGSERSNAHCFNVLPVFWQVLLAAGLSFILWLVYN